MERIEVTKQGVKLTLNKPLAGEARIAALEARLGRGLPDDYRDFLLRYNGGKPDPSVFRFVQQTGGHTDSSVEWFLSLHDGEYSNLERTVASLAGRIPPDTLPIARDAFGNIVLFGLHSDVRGKVYFWDHEEEPDQQPDWSNVSLIASSFDDFLRGLKPLPNP